MTPDRSGKGVGPAGIGRLTEEALKPGYTWM